MSRFAVVRNGIVENLVSWDPVADPGYRHHDPEITLVPAPEDAEIGMGCNPKAPKARRFSRSKVRHEPATQPDAAEKLATFLADNPDVAAMIEAKRTEQR